MTQSERSLPKFIHIGSCSTSNSFHPPPSTPPPRTLFKSQTKSSATTTTATTTSRRRIRGILKSSSYKFTGIRVKSPKKQKQQPSTPTTVGTNESADENDSTSRTSSCESSTIGSIGTFGTNSSEGIKNAIDKIINDKSHIMKPKSSCGSSNNNSIVVRSSSSTSVSSSSTSSTSVSTFSSTTKEEVHRCARIKHIEDLNERINNAKARKLVERKAYRREDKLLLRLARQLKTISKKSRENAVNIEILEESNQICEEYYNRSLEELKDLKSSRISLKERLLTDKQTKLADDREQRDRILRVQNAELEAHKRNHQYNCQALCESVLEDSNDLDRLRGLWEEYVQEGGNVRNKKGTEMSRTSFWLTIVLVFAIAAFSILAATEGGNDRITSTTPFTEGSWDQPDLLFEQQQHQDDQFRSLSPQSTIRSGIIRDVYPEDQTIISRKTVSFTSDGKNNNIVFSGPPVKCRVEKNNTTYNTETNRLSSTEPSENSICCNTDSNEDDDASNAKTNSTWISLSMTDIAVSKQEGKGKRRFKPKEAIARLFTGMIPGNIANR